MIIILSVDFRQFDIHAEYVFTNGTFAPKMKYSNSGQYVKFYHSFAILFDK